MRINSNIIIKDCYKFGFNSDINLPLNTATEFRSLVINISCIIEKDNEYYPEINFDECLYIKDNTWYIKSFLSGEPFYTKKLVFFKKIII